MAARKKPVRRGARAMLASIYKRMSAVGRAGLARAKKLRNRTGFDHLAADAEDFAYIEKEAHDILAAVARLRDRDAGEYPAPEDFGHVEDMEPMPETQRSVGDSLGEYMDTSNMTRGRRRNRAGKHPFRIAVYNPNVHGWNDILPIKNYQTEAQARFAAKSKRLGHEGIDWKVY